jgi:exosortase/archaeosortase
MDLCFYLPIHPNLFFIYRCIFTIYLQYLDIECLKKSTYGSENPEIGDTILTALIAIALLYIAYKYAKISNYLNRFFSLSAKFRVCYIDYKGTPKSH